MTLEEQFQQMCRELGVKPHQVSAVRQLFYYGAQSYAHVICKDVPKPASTDAETFRRAMQQVMQDLHAEMGVALGYTEVDGEIH